jgi:hypothetical protein
LNDTTHEQSELYIIRRKGTAGITRALRRAAPYMNEVHQCLYLFTNPMDAMKYLDFEGLVLDQWEIRSSNEFGGVASLLKKASTFATHVCIDPPAQHVLPPPPVAPIEFIIDYFESLPAEDWVNGGRKIPFWLLRHEAGGEFGIVPEPGILAICLFKSEMDAEEFRHSCWIPDETPADEWECVWPANPDGAVALLEAMSSQGISHAVINVPPGGAQRPLSTPIEVIIDHVASRGHIQDLDSP